MKKKLYIFSVFMFVLLLGTSSALAAKPSQGNGTGTNTAWETRNISCARIQDGTITDSNGIPLQTGFDSYGYNYQAHMFNGYYENYSRPAVPVTSGDILVMKWSDAWLANVDCDGDHLLDRGLVNGVPDGISKGWLTNHLNGDYDSDEDGIADAHFVDFVKIVWTGPGSTLWGQYTIIEEVYNDPNAGYNGLLTKISAPGFGLNDQWTTLP